MEEKGFSVLGLEQAEVLVTVLEKSEPAPKRERTDDSAVIISYNSRLLRKQKLFNSLKLKLKSNKKPIMEHRIAEIILKPKIYNEEEAIEETKAYIEDMAKEMGIEDLVITYETKGKYINFQLESEKAAFLIGKRGQTLNAIQQLAQLVANKVTNNSKLLRIDVADYRERREQSLEQLADRMADRAVRTKRQVALEPMPSYERKVIHNALSLRLDIETFSEGKDPYRHIVIKGIE